jgi:hypothetical protein
MDATTIRINSAALVTALLVATSAQAEYRCDAPPTRLDRRACEAAKEGPEALRHFIERVRSIERLYFPDYVNEATELAWEQARERARLAAKEASEPVTGSPPR